MKICLCGSTSFMDQFHAANVQLSLMGHIVYSVATSTKGDFQPSEMEKITLDAVHLGKIEESDAIMVVGVRDDGTTYIGESTRREMAFAAVRGKEIFFYRLGQEIVGPYRDLTDAFSLAEQSDADRARREAEEEEAHRRFVDSLTPRSESEEQDESTPLAN